MLNLPCHTQVSIVTLIDAVLLYAREPLWQAASINIRLNRILALECSESGLDPVSRVLVIRP